MKHVIKLLLLNCAALLATSAWSAECANWQQQHPEWLWCDDFESSGALGQRYEDYDTTGLSVIAGNGMGGSQGLTQQYSTGQVNAGWITKYKADGFPDHVFYRYYHKFGSGFTRFPPKMSRVGYRNHSTWEEIYRVYSWFTDTGFLTADVQAKNSSQTSSGWLPIATATSFNFASHLNEWVAIEVELKINTPGKTDGLYRTWINDQLVIERLNVDMRGSTSDKINEVMLDTYWNGGSPGNIARYYDNFVISTQKIGLVTTTASPPNPPANVQALPAN